LPVTENPLTSGGSGSDLSSYDTASIAPGANRLVLCAVTGSSAAGSPIPTLSGGGMTAWTQVATILMSDGFRRLTVFRALQASPGSGVLTIDFGAAQVRAAWAISEFIDVELGGSNGSAAVVQADEDSGSSTTPAVTLGAFGSVNNATYGAAASGSGNAMGAGAGFAEIHDVQAGAELQRLETMWRNDNDTTLTWTAGNAVWAAIGVEIKFATGGGGGGISISVVQHHRQRNF
jgi:hypothetical protein